jgi:hypothetical protein
MNPYSLTKALRGAAADNHRCLGCEYENKCSIHGCQLMKLAAATIEDLNRQVVTGGTTAQNQAIFRLGQMDMRASVASKFRTQAADFLSDCMYRRMLLVTADLIEEMEV